MKGNIFKISKENLAMNIIPIKGRLKKNSVFETFHWNSKFVFHLITDRIDIFLLHFKTLKIHENVSAYI